MNPQSIRPLALVTGASSGIGLELAREAVSRGYDVIINSEDAGGLETAAQSLQTGEAQVMTCPADLRTRDGIHTLNRWRPQASRSTCCSPMPVSA